MYKLEDDIIIIKKLRKYTCSDNNPSSSKETSRELKVNILFKYIFLFFLLLIFFLTVY